METYKFYEGFTDIYKMKRKLPNYVIKFELDPNFDPPYLSVTFPQEKLAQLLEFAENYVEDVTNINTPSRVIEIPFIGSDDEAFENVKRYDMAQSYEVEDGKLFMDIDTKMKIFDGNA